MPRWKTSNSCSRCMRRGCLRGGTMAHLIPKLPLCMLLAVALFWPAPKAWARVSSEELRQRGLEVQSMTANERERLQRNWRTFQSLPDDRKRRYRELHQHLEN